MKEFLLRFIGSKDIKSTVDDSIYETYQQMPQEELKKFEEELEQILTE